MENSGEIKKIFSYTVLAEWTNIVPACVLEFFNEFNMYPNVLYANSEVFKKLLKICLEEGIESCDPATTPLESLELGGYISHQWALKYITDDRIPECQFLLVFDPIITVKNIHHE